MTVFTLCLTAYLLLSAMAVPVPEAFDTGIALGPGSARQLSPELTNDVYSEVLGTIGRVASVNEHIEDGEEATYESTVRHLPFDESAVVEGGMERRRVQAGRGRPRMHQQKILNLPHAGNTDPLPEAERPIGKVPSAINPDDARSNTLLQTLRSALTGRYQHTVFWKQSKLPHAFYKVAAV